MESASDILKARIEARRVERLSENIGNPTPVISYRSNSYGSNSNIEATSESKKIFNNQVEGTDFEEVWGRICHLVSNKMFINKYKSLYRQGYGQQLIELAEIAETKDKPANWFATTTKVELDEVTGLKRLSDRALHFIEEVKKVTRQATQMAERIGIKVVKVAYKAVWNMKSKGVNPEAVTALAIESGKDTHRFFWYLYKESLEGRLYVKPARPQAV